MDYYFKPSAIRDLKKLPKLTQKRIVEKLDFYTQSDRPLKFAKPLQNSEFGEFRFRVGDYRIICDYNSGCKMIVILTIGHRKNIYR